MTIIYGFLIVLEALVSALLIGVIFLQKSKGGMGGAAFGGGMGEAIFGSRMGNVLTKVTVVLAIVFLTNTILLTILTARRDIGGSGSVVDKGLVEPIAAPAPMGGPVPTTPLSVPEPIAVPDDAGAMNTTPVAPSPMVDVPSTVSDVPAEDVAVDMPEEAVAPAEVPVEE